MQRSGNVAILAWGKKPLFRVIPDVGEGEVGAAGRGGNGLELLHVDDSKAFWPLVWSKRFVG